MSDSTRANSPTENLLRKCRISETHKYTKHHPENAVNCGEPENLAFISDQNACKFQKGR